MPHPTYSRFHVRKSDSHMEFQRGLYLQSGFSEGAWQFIFEKEADMHTLLPCPFRLYKSTIRSVLLFPHFMYQNTQVQKG